MKSLCKLHFVIIAVVSESKLLLHLQICTFTLWRCHSPSTHKFLPRAIVDPLQSARCWQPNHCRQRQRRIIPYHWVLVVEFKVNAYTVVMEQPVLVVLADSKWKLCPNILAFRNWPSLTSRYVGKLQLLCIRPIGLRYSWNPQHNHCAVSTCRMKLYLSRHPH